MQSTHHFSKSASAQTSYAFRTLFARRKPMAPNKATRNAKATAKKPANAADKNWAKASKSDCVKEVERLTKELASLRAKGVVSGGKGREEAPC